MEPGSEEIISLNGPTTSIRNTLHVMEESQPKIITGDSLTVSRILGKTSKEPQV